LHNKAVRVAAIFKLNWVTVARCYSDHSEVQLILGLWYLII
jgi:hypothetical protein